MSSIGLLTSFHDMLDARYPKDGVGMSYSQWIVQNTKLRDRQYSFRGYEFQQAIADDMHPNLWVIKPSQVGLALDLDTPLVTPTGWTTMGEVRVGDQLYDEQGKICNVTYISPVYTDRECYEVEFDDGEKIIADANHRWYVESPKAFNADGFYPYSGRIPKGSDYATHGILTTRAISEMFVPGTSRRFCIPNCKPLQGSNDPLPIDPYFLGQWLGDGSSSSTNICAHKDDAPHTISRLEKAGLICRVTPDGENTLSVKVDVKDRARRKVDSNTMYAHLSRLGMINNKHIPASYLRASPEARMELLQGLMDTDGSITKRGRCSFYNTNPVLVAGVEELLHSLGFKTRTRWRPPSPAKLKSGHVIQSKLDIAEISFVAYNDTPVFALPRKAGRQPIASRPSQVKRRHIIRVSKVDTVPVRCLTVDSPSHLFLAGKGMIPTHNTEIQIRKMLAFLARNRGTSAIYTLPNEKMFKRLSKTRVKPLVDTERAFSSFTDDEAKSRSMDLYEINGSFAYFTGMTEGDATSIPADYLLHDEIDLSDQVNIGLFQSRLQNSKYRITHRFSTPTLPGFAIDAGFNSSDQHEYMCKCPSCNHWQIPVFSTKFLRMPGYVGGDKLIEMTEEQYHAINTDRIEVVCEHCSRPLDLLNPELREWVARHPGRKSRGYRIRPFMNEALMPAYILGQLFEMRRLNNIRGFYNTVLGEPYSDGTNQLTEDAIKACLKGAAIPEIGQETSVVVGIDVGLICSVILGVPVGTVVQPFRFEQVRAEELVEFVTSLCQQYKIVGGAIDRYPYTPTADAVYLASGKKIVPVEYRPGPFVNIKRDEFDEIAYVQVNRTGAIDRVANLVNKRILQMRGYTQHEETIVAHMQDMVRIEAAEKDATWEKLTGNDHFFHAMGYLQASVRIADIIHSLSQDGTEDIRTEVGIFGLKSGKASSEPGLFRTRQTETADIY